MLSWLHRLPALRFAPSAPAAKARYDARLDGLRGFAAVSVMYVHVIGQMNVNAPLTAANEYVRHLHASRAAVLLFFITSGYVIGLTNRNAFTAERARDYFGRRCLRLLPIYLLALAAAWFTEPATTWGNFLANAFFLQNPAWNIPLIAGNAPVWSLHNEMVYYVGFMVLWWWQPRVLPLAVVLFFCTAADWLVGGFMSVWGGWAAGACFWLAGLLLAWHPPAAATGRLPLLAFLLLAYATNHFWPGIMLLNGLGLPIHSMATLWVSDLVILPVCIVVFAGLLQFDFPGLRFLQWLSAIIPAATCLLLWRLGRIWENVPWTMAVIATLAGLLLLAWERPGWGDALFRWFRPLGPISFALYLFHMPALSLVEALYPWQDGRLNQLGGFLCWLALTVGAAWFCELKLQPALVKWVRPSPPRPAPAA